MVCKLMDRLIIEKTTPAIPIDKLKYCKTRPVVMKRPAPQTHRKCVAEKSKIPLPEHEYRIKQSVPILPSKKRKQKPDTLPGIPFISRYLISKASIAKKIDAKSA
jgi:hypothetical protein